jgi:hypothetical protein
VLTRAQVAQAQAYMERVAKGEIEGAQARQLRVMGTSGDEPAPVPVFTSLAVLQQDEEAQLAVQAAQEIINAKRSRGMTVRGVPAAGGPDAAFVVTGDYDPTLDADYLITSMITGG